jgi:hypothetical protein
MRILVVKGAKPKTSSNKRAKRRKVLVIESNINLNQPNAASVTDRNNPRIFIERFEFN